MFGWLGRLFGWNPHRRTRIRVFRVEMPDGSVRWYDPMEVRMKMDEVLPDWLDKMAVVVMGGKDLPAGTSEKLAAMREARVDRAAVELSEAVAVAFHMPPLAPDGTDGGFGFAHKERTDMLSAFIDYCAEVAEKCRPFASPPGSTDSPGGSPPPSKSSPSS
jgi:hypothetical protein